MKKIGIFARILEIACGAAIILYRLFLTSRGSDLPYLNEATLLGACLLILGILGFFAENLISRFLRAAADIVFLATFISVMFFFVLVGSGMYRSAPEGLDCVIVLGAAVNGDRPSEALEKRIDSAAEYLRENPACRCIASGAVEEDGEISEAECIARGLIERGISTDRITREELSTTTVENMKYSSQFLDDADEGVCVVTNGFHVFRSCMILKNFTDCRVYGRSANGFNAYSPYYMTRELVVFLVDLHRGNYRIKF